MSVLKVSQMALRACGVLALILGLLVWFGDGGGLIPIHMGLGVLVVLAALVVGGTTLQAPPSRVLAVLTIVVALVLLWVGATQTTMMVGANHIVIQIIHLVLGLAVLALGEISAARFLRARAGLAA